jgi:hypothetical protein
MFLNLAESNKGGVKHSYICSHATLLQREQQHPTRMYATHLRPQGGALPLLISRDTTLHWDAISLQLATAHENYHPYRGSVQVV